jgi:hypothetical protein
VQLRGDRLTRARMLNVIRKQPTLRERPAYRPIRGVFRGCPAKVGCRGSPLQLFSDSTHARSTRWSLRPPRAFNTTPPQKKASQNYGIDVPLTFERIGTGMSRTPENRRSKNTVPVSISSAYGIDTVQQATTSYERWMSSCTTMLPTDLRLKHQQMKADPFLFLRGTFYRWAQMWSQVGGDLCNAPQVLAVGDLHVDSSLVITQNRPLVIT